MQRWIALLLCRAQLWHQACRGGHHGLAARRGRLQLGNLLLELVLGRPAGLLDAENGLRGGARYGQ
eukprot:4876652-Pyramimonas_sp.AAC.1